MQMTIVPAKLSNQGPVITTGQVGWHTSSALPFAATSLSQRKKAGPQSIKKHATDMYKRETEKKDADLISFANC
jgi:hypothetical protein